MSKRARAVGEDLVGWQPYTQRPHQEVGPAAAGGLWPLRPAAPVHSNTQPGEQPRRAGRQSQTYGPPHAHAQ